MDDMVQVHSRHTACRLVKLVQVPQLLVTSLVRTAQQARPFHVVGPVHGTGLVNAHLSGREAWLLHALAEHAVAQPGQCVGLRPTHRQVQRLVRPLDGVAPGCPSGLEAVVRRRSHAWRRVLRVGVQLDDWLSGRPDTVQWRAVLPCRQLFLRRRIGRAGGRHAGPKAQHKPGSAW